MTLQRKTPLKKVSSRPRKCSAPECDNRVLINPARHNETWCSENCAMAVLKVKLEQQAQRLEKQRRRQVKERKKDNARRKREFYENDKKHVQAQARAYLHRWIKWRDRNKLCMACKQSMAHLPQRAIQAGHYRPSGNNPAVRYHEDNIHLCCSRCNEHLSGNLVPYRANLIEAIGLEQVEWLESQTHAYKWTIDELRAIRDDYKQRLKEAGVPIPSISK